MKKRIISLVLSLAMVLSVINIFGLSAFAAGDDELYPIPTFTGDGVTLSTPDGSVANWYRCDTKDGNYQYEDSGVATISAAENYWYKFEGGLPVQILLEDYSEYYPELGGLSLYANKRASDVPQYYVSNGSMAYTLSPVNGWFDVIGIGEFPEVGKCWIGTSYSRFWGVHAGNSNSPTPCSTFASYEDQYDGAARDSIENITICFDPNNVNRVKVAITPTAGNNYVGFDTDTMLATSRLTDFADIAAVDIITNSDGTYDSAQLVGAISTQSAKANDPAFVIDYETNPTHAWVGNFSEREYFTENIISEEEYQNVIYFQHLEGRIKAKLMDLFKNADENNLALADDDAYKALAAYVICSDDLSNYTEYDFERYLTSPTSYLFDPPTANSFINDRCSQRHDDRFLLPGVQTAMESFIAQIEADGSIYTDEMIATLMAYSKAYVDICAECEVTNGILGCESYDIENAKDPDSQINQMAKYFGDKANIEASYIKDGESYRVISVHGEDSGMATSYDVSAIPDRTVRFSFSVGTVASTGASYPGKSSDSDDSFVDVSVKTDGKAPATELVTPKSELIEAVLNNEEKAAVDAGDGAEIWLEVTDISETISPESKKAIADATSEYEIGAFVDLSLFKKLDSQDSATKVHETNKPIKISMKIPENLLNQDHKNERTYFIARYHEGKVDIIKGTFDKATGVFTFETDRFSDYAIIYKDVPADKVIANTADNNMLYAWAAVFCISGMAFVVPTARSKKSNVAE